MPGNLLVAGWITLVFAFGLGMPCALAAGQPDDVYATYGVHNPPADSPCATPDCVYAREPGQPTDPQYPEYWSSKWTMYRVFQGYAKHPPPYDRVPPPPLKPERDYEISGGATYYDSTWRGASPTCSRSGATACTATTTRTTRC